MDSQLNLVIGVLIKVFGVNLPVEIIKISQNATKLEEIIQNCQRSENSLGMITLKLI